MGKICTFFGHRDSVITLEIKERIQATLIDLIEKENVDTFWFGAYGRFDADCTGIIRNLSNKYSHISMHLILPYPTKQGRKKGVFFEEEAFDSLSYFDPDKLCFPKFSILKRNAYMAKNCDFMICYVITPFGGAYQAMQKGIQAKKTVFNFAPKRDV